MEALGGGRGAEQGDARAAGVLIGVKRRNGYNRGGYRVRLPSMASRTTQHRLYVVGRRLCFYCRDLGLFFSGLWRAVVVGFGVFLCRGWAFFERGDGGFVSFRPLRTFAAVRK